MSPFQLLFGFSLILSVQADWTCPNATLKLLENGTGIFPYPGDDYKYKAGAKCNLTISVPSGLYISVYFDIFSQDDKYGVYDDTGTYFYQSENNKTTPPESLTTATNVHIQIFAQNSGQFKIRWYFNNLDISPNARCKNSVDYLKGYVLDLSTMWQCGSTAVITSSWDVTIFRGINANKTRRYTDRLFIFCGSSRTYLGSLITLDQLQTLSCSGNAVVTVYTIVRYESTNVDALLFRPSSSIQNLTYSFYWTGTAPSNFTIKLDATAKPSAITIYSNTSTQLMELTSLKTQSTVYWLAGTNVDLDYSITSFSPSSDLYHGESLGTVPLYANTYTFLLFNGTATLNFQQLTFACHSTYYDDYYTMVNPSIIVTSGDYGYLATANYRIPNYIDYNSFYNKLQITTSPDIGVTIQAVDNYNTFNLYYNGKYRKLKQGDTFTVHGTTFFSLTYYMDNSTADIGGLLRFDARMSSQRLLSLTFVVSILRLFA